MDIEGFEAAQKQRKAANLAGFPKPGARLRYRGAHPFWFTNIIANAERDLRVGEVYTLKSIEVASSWACITLAETGDSEFALSFFEPLATPPS